MPELRLAVIGLGNMGAPMTRNLLGAGFDVTVTDLDPAKVAALVAHGATAATDAVAAVADADVVLTSLPGPAQIKRVGDLIVPAMRPSAIWVELSTNDLDGPELLNGGYDDTFDLGLAEQVGASLPFTADVGRLYDEAEFGFDAPHLMAMQRIEHDNELTLHEQIGTPVMTTNREVTADDFAAANAGSFTGDEWQARIDLAAMYRLAAHFGYDDLVWNHITMRVPGSDHDFFLNKFGLLYNEVTASNLIKVDSDGTVLEGPADVNTAGFVIHSAIHNDFPKWKVVFHAHVPDALAVTALANGFEHLVQDTSMLYGEIGYHDWEGLSLTLEERERLAKNMDGNRALIMRNHGFLTVGETAGEAFMVMHYLIRGCRTLLKAHGSSLDVDPGPTDIWELSKRQYDHFPLGKHEWPALLRLLDQQDPSYRQ